MSLLLEELVFVVLLVTGGVGVVMGSLLTTVVVRFVTGSGCVTTTGEFDVGAV